MSTPTPTKQLTIQPFDTYGNLYGVAHAPHHFGRLPEQYRIALRNRVDRGFIDYTVFSYATPIAWHDTERGWQMPPAKYSTTTSKAQGKIAAAIAALKLETRKDN